MIAAAGTIAAWSVRAARLLSVSGPRRAAVNAESD
jgi:hypothetical protein